MSRLQANALLLTVAAIWGSTFAIQQVAMDMIGPMAFTAARFTLGAIAILPLALFEQRYFKKRNDAKSFEPFGWQMVLITIGVGAVLFLGTILQQIGLKYTTVTNAGFLTGLYVVLVPVLGFLLFKRAPHWSVWPAALACLVGTFILSGAYKGLAISVGDLWVISCTIFWALHVLLIGAFGHKSGMPIRFACIQFFVCGVIAGIWMLIDEPISLSMFVDAGWYIVYAGVISVGIAFTLQIIGQGSAPAADAAIILSMETVFAAIAGGLFLGEKLDAAPLFGCGIILSAVLAVELLPMVRARMRYARP